MTEPEEEAEEELAYRHHRRHRSGSSHHYYMYRHQRRQTDPLTHRSTVQGRWEPAVLPDALGAASRRSRIPSRAQGPRSSRRLRMAAGVAALAVSPDAPEAANHRPRTPIRVQGRLSRHLEWSYLRLRLSKEAVVVVVVAAAEFPQIPVAAIHH